MIQCKRIYLPPSKNDGTRILVERLWPRGITKERASLGLWLKDIAPSDELRRWFGHAPARWETFQTRYRAELETLDDSVAKVLELARHNDITLVYAARDEPGNSATVLKEFLLQRLSGEQ